MTIRKFKFDTGVKVYNNSYLAERNEISPNGVIVILFECEDVPDGVIFDFACDADLSKFYPNHIKREILNSNLNSKYAYFKVDKHD